MSLFLKIAMGLTLALPMSAYVVGSLVASADEPAPREVIVIRDSATSPGPEEQPGRTTQPRPDHRGEDDGQSVVGDDDVEVVLPEPDDIDDDGDDSGRDGDDTTDDGHDNSGPGGGGDDDSSGPGGGGDDDEGDDEDEPEDDD